VQRSAGTFAALGSLNVWVVVGLLCFAAVLGDTVCIRGNVPPALLNLGSPEEVRGYCRELIQGVGKGGGFLMDGAIGIPDEAKPENLRAMADAVKDYGVYS